MKKVFIGLILCLAVPTLAFGQPVYIQSLKAPLKKEPRFKSPVVATVKRGDQLNQLKAQGSWLLLSGSGKEGWVPKLMVSKQPPLAKVSDSVLAKTNVKLEKHARRRVSSYTTAAAARGLMEERARKGRTKYKADLDSVAAVESFQVSRVEVARFMEEGGLQ